MADARADEVLRRFAILEGNRGIWNQHWTEINDRVMVRPSGFNRSIVPGSKNTSLVFDSTAAQALLRYAAAVESVLCARNQQWHGLEPADPEIADDPECKAYCEALTKLLFRVRYGAFSSFSAEAQECFLELGAFGTHIMLCDDAANHERVTPSRAPIVYQSMPLCDSYIEENALGRVDTLYRLIRWDARQVIHNFGIDKTPRKIVEAYDKKQDRKWTFIHRVSPTVDYDRTAWDRRALPYSSCYVWRDEPETVEESGLRTMPYAVGRSTTNPDEVYGRSPAMTVLPDIKMVNEVNKTMIRAGHKLVDPPLLIYDDGLGSMLDVTPNALNYGMMDESGHARAAPLNSGGRYDVGVDQRQDLRTSINTGFYITLFQILVENRQMTAYEAMLRAQEKAELLGPTFGRQESEFLAPIIERELDILWSKGIIQRTIGPMPRKLEQSGGILQIAFTNQLAYMRRAPEAVRTLTSIQQLAPLASIDPAVMEGFDPDGVREVIMDANGVPQKARRTPEQLAAFREQKQAQANAAALVQAAPLVGSAVKDIAQAQSTADVQRLPVALPRAA